MTKVAAAWALRNGLEKACNGKRDSDRSWARKRTIRIALYGHTVFQCLDEVILLAMLKKASHFFACDPLHVDFHFHSPKYNPRHNQKPHVGQVLSQVLTGIPSMFGLSLERSGFNVR